MTRDAELFHFVGESCTLQAKPRCGTFWSADEPIEALEGVKNVSALGVLECGQGQPAPDRRTAQFAQGRSQRPARGQDDGAFDEILKLADIARPGVLDEPFHTLLRDNFDAFLHSAGEHCDEILDKQGNILSALPQWRDTHGKNVEPVIEVASKFTFGHHARQVPARCCHEPSVHTNRMDAAEPFKFLLLHNSQKLRLKFEGNITDLIQEQRAFVGQIKTPNLPVERTREGTSFMTEEFALEQSSGDRSAIDFCEGAILPATSQVDSASDEFLAGSSFAQDQDCGIRGGYGLNFLQRVKQ
ncbi:MAG TPA: hypothetical protein VJR23_06845 [Candidatus Acidoferrales bacterium]|nr:hypothetical protein [Candidatus Acidoferrales bacterium]